MQSSPGRPRTSHPSLGSSRTAAALRRGDLKISDPIFVDQDTALQSGWEAPSVALVYTRQGSFEESWPRPSTSSEPRTANHETSLSSIDIDRHQVVMLGPPVLPSASVTPVKATSNQAKGVGIRATLKRVLGSKRHRSVSIQDEQIFSPGADLVRFTRDDDIFHDSHEPELTNHDNEYRPLALTSHLPPAPPTQTPSNPKDRPAKTTTRLQRRNSVPNTLGRRSKTGLSLKQVTADAPDRPKASKSPLLQESIFPYHLSKSASDLHGDTSIFSEIPAVPIRHDAHYGFPNSEQRNTKVPHVPQVFNQKDMDILNPTPLRISPQQQASNISSMEPFDFAFDDTSPEPPTLEDRVNTLEVKMFDFEFAIARLQGHDVPKPSLQNGPTKQRSLHKLFNKSEKRAAPHAVASSPNLGGMATLQDSEPRSFFDTSSHYTSSSSRGTTIRPHPRHHSPADDLQRSTTSSVRLRLNQYENLMHLIKQEQEARLQMERKIVELQQEIEVLKTPVFATIKPLVYPTPSPDSFQEHAVGHRTLHRTQAFQWDRPSQEITRTSTNISDRLSSTNTQSNEQIHDGFHTPRENQFFFQSAPTSPQAGFL